MLNSTPDLASKFGEKHTRECYNGTRGIGIIDAMQLGIMTVTVDSSCSRQTCSFLIIYNIANPTTPTAPRTQDAAFACAAPPVELAVGEAAAPVPLALPLAAPAPLVPLGLPEIFSWETETPLPFLQFEL